MDEPVVPAQEDVMVEQPTQELAAHILRELTWEERIEGTVFDPGPGAETERIYGLEAMSNLLKSMPNFDVDLLTLQRWIAETVGDLELAAAIQTLLGESTGDSAGAAERMLDDGVPDGVSALIALRVKQCREVLSAADASGSDSALGDESEPSSGND